MWVYQHSHWILRLNPSVSKPLSVDFRYWILEFPAEFNLDLGLIRLTEEFRELASQLGYEDHIHLIDISSM